MQTYTRTELAHALKALRDTTPASVKKDKLVVRLKDIVCNGASVEKKCKEGQILNPKTNRCIKKKAEKEQSKKPNPKSPSPVKPRSPSPVKPKSPSPVKPRSPSPVKPKSPSPMKPKSPSSLKKWEKTFGDLFEEGNAGLLRYTRIQITVRTGNINHTYDISGEMSEFMHTKNSKHVISINLFDNDTWDVLNEEIYKMIELLQVNTTADSHIAITTWQGEKKSDPLVNRDSFGLFFHEVCGVPKAHIQLYDAVYDSRSHSEILKRRQW